MTRPDPDKSRIPLKRRLKLFLLQAHHSFVFRLLRLGFQIQQNLPLPVTGILPHHALFLAGGKRLKRLEKEPLTFKGQTGHRPEVSIIIPFYNERAYTYACLKSIHLYPPSVSHEIILVDDGSTDDTSEWLESVSGITVLRHAVNQGFVEACHTGAAHARGRYLAFLNNDVLVTPRWLDELYETFQLESSTGLCGSKFIYPSGLLQEAGGIIFSDASAQNRGGLSDPNDPEFNYLKDVDYCSAASIMIPKELFEETGGFDRIYKQGYYDDVDLAFRVRQSGKRVLFQPRSVVVHFEKISFGKLPKHTLKYLVKKNKEVFFNRWSHTLQANHPIARNLKNAWCFSHRPTDSKRILIIDHRPLTPDEDAGSWVVLQLARVFQSLGYEISFIPDNLEFHPKHTGFLQKQGLRCLHTPFIRSVGEHLKREGAGYNLLMVCRADVASKHLDTIKRMCPGTPILYNTIDLHFLRELQRSLSEDSAEVLGQAHALRIKELSIVRRAEATLVFNSEELKILRRECPQSRVQHILPPWTAVPGKNPFHRREGLAYLGGYEHKPNVDAVIYFVNSIWPIIKTFKPEMKFYVLGSKPPSQIRKLENRDIIVTGHVPDLGTFMNTLRLTVAPLRYGAGIKGKVITSLGLGVPVVASSIAWEGMPDGASAALIADDPRSFAEAVIRLYDNETLWTQCAAEGLDLIQKYFSFRSCQREISELVRMLHEPKTAAPEPFTPVQPERF